MIEQPTSPKTLRRRRSIAILLVLFSLLIAQVIWVSTQQNPPSTEVLSDSKVTTEVTLASVELDQLLVKGRAPKTGYKRAEFGDGWASIQDCDTRNLILRRDLTNIALADDDCIVLSGTLNDPYTNTIISFLRGSDTSSEVQIDHVVALSDAWQKGAQQLSEQDRVRFANDPMNLLAVDGDTNQKKGDSDAASWLPPNKVYRCRYVARQIAVKRAYALWVTDAEKSAMKRVLNTCPNQPLPERE